MLTLEKKNSLAKKFDNLSDSIESFHGSLREYKKILSAAGAKTKALEALPAEPPAAVPNNGNNGHTTGSSLFDGLLQDFIRENNFEIQPDSEAEINYRIVLENTPDPVVEMDPSGIILSVNPSFTNSFEYREPELTGRIFLDLVPEDYHPGLTEGLHRACGDNFGKYKDTLDDIIVFRAAPKSGRQKSLEGIFYAYEKNGLPVLVLLIRDLTYSRSLFDELQEAKDHYNALSETISETIIRLDEDFIIIFVNSAVQKTFGYQRDEVKGQHFSILFPPGIFQRNKDVFKKYFIVDDLHRKDLGLDVTIEALGNSKHRGLFPMEMSFGNSKEYNGRTMTCILRDITQRKHNERKLRHLAYHDKLTGLGNRDLFNSDIRTLFQALREQPGTQAALMFLDLDGFKQVNDTLGHKAGDILLIDTARRLRGSLRETDSVYRFGGDEFVVLLHSIQQRDNAAMIGSKLLKAIREPYDIQQEDNTTTVNVGVSIGIALIPEDGDKPDTATKNADLAMYSAKEAGKNTYVFFTRDMDDRAVKRWEIEQGLKKALAARELTLHYQPLVEKNGHILGVEALVRWNHPEGGMVSPAVFIPTAEETGLIIPMGNWILETACRKMQYLNSRGFPDLFVSVNLSPRQFDHPDFLDITGNIIRRTGIKPENLKLELTETSIMNAPETAIEKMHLLKKQHPGVSIAIDDFGTGYSSLSYLSRLPADIIKIDLSFVTKLFQETNQKIVNAIISLAQSLDLRVVAEGVETEKQLQYFVDKGCKVLQGHYFYKAVDFDVLRTELLKTRAGGD